jgi:hypothetical protein
MTAYQIASLEAMRLHRIEEHKHAAKVRDCIAAWARLTAAKPIVIGVLIYGLIKALIGN